jgi:tetratricopeptide (TPR) repeat protein
VESLLGHGQAAWEAATTARALSPMDPLKHYYDALAASAAVAAGRYEECCRLALLSLSKDARHLPTLRALAIAQVRLGRLPQARATVARLLRINPEFTRRDYVANAPRGGEEVRRRWAEDLAEAGAP